LKSTFTQNAILKDPAISINRVTWSGDGDFIGKCALRKFGSNFS